jgi:hypothetical protein
VVGGCIGVVVVIVDEGVPVKESRAALNDRGFRARIFAPQVSTVDLLPHPKSVAV